jgi:hypothetical protein
MTLPPTDRLVRNWRYRSAEMRAISETMKHDETRATMERLADSYDEMADKMEHRLKLELERAKIADDSLGAAAPLSPSPVAAR